MAIVDVRSIDAALGNMEDGERVPTI